MSRSTAPHTVVALRTAAAAVLAVAALGATVTEASATPAVAVAPAVAVPPAANAPAPEPADRSTSTRPTSTCSTSADEKTGACLTIAPRSAGAPVSPDSPSTNAVQPLPQWCIDNANDGLYATRTNACEIFTVTFQTYLITNGVRTVTGEVRFNAYNFAYTSTNLGSWAHQFQLQPYYGFGDAMRATVSAAATGRGACTRSSSSFPPTTVTPLSRTMNGESFFNTTATARGAIGSCTTTWTLTFTTPGYSTATLPINMTAIRCDNATAGNTSVGCVVPWYASAIVYSRSSYPSLASHVSRALASGLPGGSFAAPLTRTTNQTVVDRNRQLACGDAPSVAGKSCDEYPIAQSYQGLSAGGTRRTFDNCTFNLPRATGPSGVSVCMITATENNAQGGIHTQFFRRERVLDRDPFRVLIGT